MKSTRNIIVFVALLLLMACVGTSVRHEKLRCSSPMLLEITSSAFPKHQDLPQYKGDWKLAHSEVIKEQYAIDEFVLKEESIENWTRLFTQQNLNRRIVSASTPKSMMIGLKNAMTKRCPDVVWKVIQESENDILYEYHFNQCPGHPDQHEIARILYGQLNIWRIAYTQKGPPMDEKERLKWYDALSNLRIIAE